MVMRCVDNGAHLAAAAAAIYRIHHQKRKAPAAPLELHCCGACMNFALLFSYCVVLETIYDFIIVARLD